MSPHLTSFFVCFVVKSSSEPNSSKKIISRWHLQVSYANVKNPSVKERKLPRKEHVAVRVCRLLWRASGVGLLVMRVACCTGWGDLVIGRCLHCCLSRRRCRQVAPRHVFVNVINTASTHIHVSCLTFGLCLNSLSLTAQQRGCSPPPHHPPAPVAVSRLSSATARPSRRLMFRMSLTSPLWPFQRRTRQGPFEACPSASPCIDNRRLSAGAD